jgi:transcriptional regulator with XRE-family HTH domain
MIKLSRPIPRDLTTLSRLAAELNVPVEAFLGDPSEGDVGELLALIRLWSAIQDSQGRRRVLSAARLEAERSSDKACA